MKRIINITLGLAALALSAQRSFAADATVELHALLEQVQQDIDSGKTNETELSGDLKQFDTLLAEHKGEKTEAVAEILFMKAQLYDEVLDEDGKAVDVIKQLKADFPDTELGTNADDILAELTRKAEAEKIQAALAVGTEFPNFSEKDVTGQPLSVANDKGKVVLIDFWATWCPPCRAEVPNIVDTYQKYHTNGFDIIGISLDQDQTNLLTFTKENDMPWPQYFDGQGWDNKLAIKYGILSIPADYLLDGSGKIIGKNLFGPDLQQAVATAVKKK
ncbi:MAG TPA: TlpA disulfide reductase family protein [Verrucomicrobiae bacterium]|nr:TlpA disulfide reductase family protein [Verrucomicrobiae bacterium]